MFKEQNALLLLSLSLGLALAVDICEYQLNGIHLSHPADCNKFVECQNGKTDRIMNCLVGLHFNRFTGECDLRERAACDIAFINLASEEANCSAYCARHGCDIKSELPGTTDTDEKPNTQDTPAIPATSGISNTPLTASNAGASDTPSPETPETPASPETYDIPSLNARRCSNNLTVCSGKSDGSVLRVNGTCNQYIVCDGQCAYIMPCPANLQYNIETKRCDHPQNVTCPWQSNTPTTGPSGVTCANRGQCANEEDGKMFASSQGNGYVVCQCQCEIKRPCPDGTKFNVQLLTCALESGNGTGSGNGGGNGGENGNGSGNGNGGGNESGNGGENGNGNGSGNGNGGGNESGNGGENGNGGGNGNGSGCGNGCGCGCENGCGCGNGCGNGNGTENGGGNGNGSENGGGNGNGTENGGGSGSGNNNSTSNICGNEIQVCKNQNSSTLLPISGICNKFYQCNHGCAVEISCPNNLVFNPNKKICDYPKNYKCPWPHNPPSGPSAGPSGIACASGGRCTGKDDGTFFPSLTNCSKYIVCQCECEREVSCPKSLYWDSKLSTCNYPHNVKCVLA